MTDDPIKALEELRQRIASEGLPRLSVEALRAGKLDRRQRPATHTVSSAKPLTLSDEARRLFQQKSDPQWLWRRR
jgi:hypothetical protein